MFVHLLLILLPAATLAQCNIEVVMQLFDSLDVNSDNKVTRLESDEYFKAFDRNRDKIVTLEEVKERVNCVDPTLKGHEEELFNFIEVDSDRIITSEDNDLLFEQIDEDRDGATSSSEYERFLEKRCQPYNPDCIEPTKAMQHTYYQQ